MRVLITGGAGFIGVSLCKMLSAMQGDSNSLRVTAIDNLHPQVHRFNVPQAELPNCVELITADVCDFRMWDRVLRGFYPDILVLLAAETGTSQSLYEAYKHTNVNVSGVAVMLDAISASKIFPKRIVLASSRAVYGNGQWIDPADGTSFTARGRSHPQLASGLFDIVAPSGRVGIPLAQSADLTPPSPCSIYGATKLAQEHILFAWCHANDVPATFLRLQNVYGPGQSPFNIFSGVLMQFHQLAIAGKAIEVFEDGKIGRDFVFIEDVAKVIFAAISSNRKGVSIVDVGTGKMLTMAEVARVTANLYNAPEPQISGQFRFGDVRCAFADTNDMYVQFGLRADTNFTTGNLELSRWLLGQHAQGTRT